MITHRNVPIGEVVRNARPFWAERQAMRDDQITQIVDDQFELLAARNINYLLVGGIALLHYVEGRNTEASDVILAEPDVQSLQDIYVEIEARIRHYTSREP